MKWTFHLVWQTFYLCKSLCSCHTLLQTPIIKMGKVQFDALLFIQRDMTIPIFIWNSMKFLHPPHLTDQKGKITFLATTSPQNRHTFFVVNENIVMWYLITVIYSNCCSICLIVQLVQFYQNRVFQFEQTSGEHMKSVWNGWWWWC